MIPKTNTSKNKEFPPKNPLVFPQKFIKLPKSKIQKKQVDF
jgi:hypothetical protein